MKDMEGDRRYANNTKNSSGTYKSFEYQQNDMLHFSQHQDYIDGKSCDTSKLFEEGEENQMERTLFGAAQRNKDYTREASTGRKVLIMAACLYLHIIASGLAVSLGVVYVDLIRVFDASHSQAALVQSIFIGTTLGGGVIFTSVLQRFGPAMPVMIASLISGLAFFASSFATNVPILIALIGIIGGTAMCVNFLAAYVVVGWTFQENKKFVLGILTFGWTTGQISFPYLAGYLLDELSWNGSFVILSGLIFNCIPCGLLLYISRHFILVRKLPATKFRDTVSICLTDYTFVLYLTHYAFFMFMAPVEIWFLVDMAVLKGFARSTGTFLLSLIGIFAFVGRVFGTVILRLFQQTDALIHNAYSVVLWGVAHYLVGYFDVLWGLILAMVLRGVFNGISGAATPGSQIEVRGIEMFPQTVAICNFLGGVSQILGGLLGGATVDLTGGYELIFTLAAFVFFLCGILLTTTVILRKRQKRLATSNAIVPFNAEEENDIETKPLITDTSSVVRYE